MLTQSLALIGFPCSGKSTLGRLMAEQLACPWFDSDQELTSLSGHEPAYWFQQEGEAGFRAREKAWLLDWQPSEACVLSTGGGLPCFEDNLSILKAKSLTIYLELDFETLYQRLIQPPGHNLTHVYTPEGLQNLYQQRCLIYAQADLTLQAQASPEVLWQELRYQLGL